MAMALRCLRLHRTLPSIPCLYSLLCSPTIFKHSTQSQPPRIKTPSFFLSQSRTFSIYAASMPVIKYSYEDEGDQCKIDPRPVPGCDYNHWLITLEFPRDPKPSPEAMVRNYERICAQGLNISIEEAKKKIYACSTTAYTGFHAVMTEEESKKFLDIPGVLLVLPDSYIDPVNKEYGGDKYENGIITPRPPPMPSKRSHEPKFERNFKETSNSQQSTQFQEKVMQGGPTANQRGNTQDDQRGFMQGVVRNFDPQQDHPQQQNYSYSRGPQHAYSPHQRYGPLEGPSQEYSSQECDGPLREYSSRECYSPRREYSSEQSYGPPGCPQQEYPSQQRYGFPPGGSQQVHSSQQSYSSPGVHVYPPQQSYVPLGDIICLLQQSYANLGRIIYLLQHSYPLGGLQHEYPQQQHYGPPRDPVYSPQQSYGATEGFVYPQQQPQQSDVPRRGFVYSLQQHYGSLRVPHQEYPPQQSYITPGGPQQDYPPHQSYSAPRGPQQDYPLHQSYCSPGGYQQEYLPWKSNSSPRNPKKDCPPQENFCLPRDPQPDYTSKQNNNPQGQWDRMQTNNREYTPRGWDAYQEANRGTLLPHQGSYYQGQPGNHYPQDQNSIEQGGWENYRSCEQRDASGDNENNNFTNAGSYSRFK